jgi:hypothetical protein
LLFLLDLVCWKALVDHKLHCFFLFKLAVCKHADVEVLIEREA